MRSPRPGNAGPSRRSRTFYTRDWLEALAALNVQPADVYPRASAYVEQMIEFAKVLEDQGYTYLLPSGLYFDTSRSPGYGQLALLDLAGQRETGRVEHVEGRKHSSDFALWRAEEPGVRRIMRWNSPWGWGAPGWHLECSVMSMALLGDHFDIHTGGIDHRELHHVNEIAQSEAFLEDDRPWVRYWLHNEFILLDAQKIAKSAGHTLRLADLVEAGFHPMAYRLFLLGGHYRSQLDFTMNGDGRRPGDAAPPRHPGGTAAPAPARGNARRRPRAARRDGRRRQRHPRGHGRRQGRARLRRGDRRRDRERPGDPEAARHPPGRAPRPGRSAPRACAWW